MTVSQVFTSEQRELLRLDGRVALISGAAHGVGRATARVMAGRGAKVALFDLSLEHLNAAASELREAGCDVIAIHGNGTSESDCIDAVARVEREWGRLDILLNSIGPYAPDDDDRGGAGPASDGPLEGVTLDAWRGAFTILIDSTFLLSRAALPLMKQGGWGRIVNLSSMAGVDGNPRSVTYSAVKSAIIGMSRSLALQVAKDGILVNCVAPALIVTERIADRFAEQSVIDEWAKTSNVALARPATLDEAARTIAYMCSEEMTYTTGYVWDLSGGRSYR
jgi:NAD(P)-dependent dehydrogenase (short-subunit alcohol dehydrogenase family)